MFTEGKYISVMKKGFCNLETFSLGWQTIPTNIDKEVSVAAAMKSNNNGVIRILEQYRYIFR